MTILYISSLLLITLLACGAVLLVHRAYYRIIDGLRSDIKDLRDRLFQKNALPPSGVDLTEKYEARQERLNVQRDDPNPKLRSADPLKQVRDRWKKKDLAAAERGVDVTNPHSRFDNN